MDLLRSRLQATRFRPRFEKLEARYCPSVTVTTVALPDGTNELKIVGDTAADTINIADQGNGNIAVTDGAAAALGSATNVSLIKFRGMTSTDTINYTLANVLTHSESLDFKLGSGGDGHVALDFSKGVQGADLSVSVDGNKGNDMIAATMGSLSASHTTLKLCGGAGDDNISVTAHEANIAANASFRTILDGGQGKDTLAYTFDGQVLGKLSYFGAGGYLADNITGNITVNAGSTGRVRAEEHGGPGVDTVTLNVHNNSNGTGKSTLAALHAAIFDFHGNDLLTHTSNVKIFGGHGVQTTASRGHGG